MSDSETLLKTYGLVQRIDERTENTDKKVESICTTQGDHEVRIRTLETQEAVQEVRMAPRNPNPLLAGVTIGGLSWNTLLLGLTAIATKLIGAW